MNKKSASWHKKNRLEKKDERSEGGAKKKHHYVRKELYPVSDVLSELGDFKKDFDGDLIKMDSARYKLFSKSVVCVHCGLEGKYFAKERFQNVDTYHFNLYGVRSNGDEVLMTKDHIIPRARGGSDGLSNYQVMCEPCNAAKSDDFGYDIKNIAKAISKVHERYFPDTPEIEHYDNYLRDVSIAVIKSLKEQTKGDDVIRDYLPSGDSN